MSDDLQALEAQQNAAILLANNTCKEIYGNVTEKLFNTTRTCPGFFDQIACWSPTPANTTAILKCPNYIVGFLNDQNATKYCKSDGTWFNWTNYTSCMNGNTTQVPVDSNITSSVKTYYVPIIKIISQTGYTISFFTLVFAFLIMYSIKKLHCARNKLHMHLFASFIMRAGITLLKDFLITDTTSGSWGCKLLIILFNFFITANYSWILMEGLYLYNLIFCSMFADSNVKITQYIVLGWGVPFIIIIAWTIARMIFADTYCWTTHHDGHDAEMTFWIIRLPTAISIILNMYLFIRIVIVIYIKLQAPNQDEQRSYLKWARSTLVLAPLFGIHYALLIFLSSAINLNDNLEIIWLFADQLFASSQGFVVAILYCFLNSEVRTELQPHIYAFLAFLASNNCLKFLFPCRQRYLRSARARMSVCTTMSCSSLVNNGVNHKNSRTGQRSDTALKNKNDKLKDHVCQSNTRCNEQTRFAHGSIKQFLANETNSQQNERNNDDFQDETICMLPTSLNQKLDIETHQTEIV